ncbi:MAG: 3'(2'),5'-bisphosphate nucleotidase CysQ, partial [Henriciella sp.]|nr:3'(2'),5'-bisphosphate nucleotidase CysQ [Henriciella sp.]
MTRITGEQLARIALDAGKLVMDIYSTDFDVERKDDASPVSEADAMAEILILVGLIAAEPDLMFIGEESVCAGKIPVLGL